VPNEKPGLEMEAGGKSGKPQASGIRHQASGIKKLEKS